MTRDDDKISTSFSTKFLYRQSDIALTEHGNFEASTAIWAVSWMYDGLSHPLSSRIRITIVHSVDAREFTPISADIEIWNDYKWNLIDSCLQGINPGRSIELIENECLHMTESFLMGTAIEEVREKYGVEKDSEDISSNPEEDEERENVLKLFPKKD